MLDYQQFHFAQIALMLFADNLFIDNKAKKQNVCTLVKKKKKKNEKLSFSFT